MKRVLSLFLPWWKAERARRRLSVPGHDAVLLVHVKAGQQIVAVADAVAAQAGVRAGLSLAHAKGLLTGIRVHTQDEDATADHHVLTAFARWAARRWSPVVSVDAPDGLLLDISGCTHLFHGEEGLLSSLERSVRALGFTPRLGIASTVGTAWALARFAEGEDCIARAGSERHAIAPLPTAALRVESDIVEALAEVGIDSVGQLLDLPRHALTVRYGPDLLRRLDQALGVIPEMVDRTSESLSIHSSRELPGGTTWLETIERVVKMLLVNITAALATHESGLRRLDVLFERMNAEPQAMAIQVSRATRDDRHLWSLLRPKVERLHMGFGVERVTLKVGGITRLVHRQASLAVERDDAWKHDGEFAAMLDTLASRLGRTNVMRAELMESHRPERAFRLFSFDEAGTSKPGEISSVGPRPSRLFDTPCPVEILALYPDGPVRCVRWDGGDHAILSSIGPERVGPEWWKGKEPARDYYRVQDETGRWLWLFRETCGRWFVHGEWC